MSDLPAGPIGRRDFLRAGGAAAAGFLATGVAPGRSLGIPPLPMNPATQGAMPTRNLGRTGYRVGIFSLGGQAAIERADNEAVAIPIIERALDLGVNYVDTAAAYGRGWSQRYVGQVMRRRRGEVFLASKTHDRTRDGSLRLLEESLRTLNTDHLDLWQLHRVSTPDDVAAIFAPGGAIEALVQARDQGLVRFLGVSGHADPGVLAQMLERFPFDTILMAINAADRHHLPFAERLLPLAVERQMGIIGMKIPARSRILAGWTPPPPRDDQPIASNLRPGALTMREAMYYTLSLPVSTVIIGCDSVAQVEENVALARGFNPLSVAQLDALGERTAPIARQALFFRSWS